MWWDLVGIAALSIAGVASRIALLSAVESSHFFPESSQISVNILGSFLIGITFGSSGFQSAFPHTFTALCVGFCGSLTTFSSWIRAMMSATGSTPAVEFITGISMPLTACVFGVQLSEMCFKTTSRVITPKLFDKILILLFTTAAITSLVTLHATSRFSQQIILSCALGPLGALTRFLLARTLNPRLKNFFLGTLLANLIAVVLTGSLENCENQLWCTSATVGISGSLSTVSSWVLDTIKLFPNSKLWACFYYLSTAALGILVYLPFLYR
jgi:fluoride ion exporter CrcB/FEX